MFKNWLIPGRMIILDTYPSNASYQICFAESKMKIWYSRLARSKESLHWPEIKNEHPHEPASSGALVIRQLNYIENGGKRQMAMYRTCPLCGANLDPGELCDCQDGEESDG